MPNCRDYRGMRFGFLVAVEPTEKRNNYGSVFWKFRCDCGRVVERIASNVKKSKNQSCGCYRKVDLTGQRFGKVVAIEPTGRTTKHGDTIWKFLCDCGNTTEHATPTATNGDLKSCGCGRRLQPDEIEDALIRHLYASKKSETRGRRKEIVWDLSLEEFTGLVTSPCIYCGGKDYISRRYSSKRTKMLEGELCGVDRRDSSRGYTADNCDPCCQMCNYAKNRFPQDDFINWIARLVKHNTE